MNVLNKIEKIVLAKSHVIREQLWNTLADTPLGQLDKALDELYVEIKVYKKPVETTMSVKPMTDREMDRLGKWLSANKVSEIIKF